jgi:hypothetical protein
MTDELVDNYRRASADDAAGAIYVVTKSLDDFGLMQGLPALAPGAEPTATQIMRIPAPLLCYWMGATEIPQADG